MNSSFKEKVFCCCSKVPCGKVTTYARIASALGSPNSSRAVGNALNKNEDTKRVPCHRVIRSNGSVGGYAQGTKKKIQILKKEGVIISKKNLIDLKEFGYDYKK